MTDTTQNFLKIASQNQAQFAFQFYRVLKEPEKIKLYQLQDQPNTFVYIYKHFITTYGHKSSIETILHKIRSKNELDPTTRYEITFQNHHLTIIKSYFDDFDVIDEFGVENAEFNHIQTMSLNKTNFTPKRLLKSGKRIREDLLDHFDPDLKEFVESGYVYGIIENTHLISMCPVPFVYKKENFSFSILHRIYTDEKFRHKGYGTGAVRSALNFLFTRKIIKSVYVWVDEENAPAVHMLDKIGFESAGQWIGSRCFLKS